ncbi:hypothetical protein HDU93_007333, partial [Gonapodya sp. JEL0774]
MFNPPAKIFLPHPPSPDVLPRSSLPPEVLEFIIWHVVTPSDLYSCALVNKTFAIIAVPQLWTTATLDLSDDGVKRKPLPPSIMAVLRQGTGGSNTMNNYNPRVPARDHERNLSFNYPSFLRRLAVRGRRAEDILPVFELCGPQLVALDIRGIVFSSQEQLSFGSSKCIFTYLEEEPVVQTMESTTATLISGVVGSENGTHLQRTPHSRARSLKGKASQASSPFSSPLSGLRSSKLAVLDASEAWVDKSVRQQSRGSTTPKPRKSSLANRDATETLALSLRSALCDAVFWRSIAACCGRSLRSLKAFRTLTSPSDIRDWIFPHFSNLEVLGLGSGAVGLQGLEVGTPHGLVHRLSSRGLLESLIDATKRDLLRIAAAGTLPGPTSFLRTLRTLEVDSPTIPDLGCLLPLLPQLETLRVSNATSLFLREISSQFVTSDEEDEASDFPLPPALNSQSQGIALRPFGESGVSSLFISSDDISRWRTEHVFSRSPLAGTLRQVTIVSSRQCLHRDTFQRFLSTSVSDLVCLESLELRVGTGRTVDDNELALFLGSIKAVKDRTLKRLILPPGDTYHKEFGVYAGKKTMEVLTVANSTMAQSALTEIELAVEPSLHYTSGKSMDVLRGLIEMPQIEHITIWNFRQAAWDELSQRIADNWSSTVKDQRNHPRKPWYLELPLFWTSQIGYSLKRMERWTEGGDGEHCGVLEVKTRQAVKEVREVLR